MLAGDLEAGAVHIDSLFAALCASQDHLVAFADIAVFHHGQVAVVADYHAGIHAALLRQDPLPVDLDIFGVHGGAVVVVRRHSVLLRHGICDVGRVYKLCFSEVWRVIDGHIKRHVEFPPVF